MTHGKLWPAHPKPFYDELLSSWVVRVVNANHIKLQTLTRMLFGESLSPWMRDIDRNPPFWLLDSFCKYTGVERRTALDATLNVYRGRLFNDNRMSGHQKWLLTLSLVGTKRKAYGLQFCPLCLADDHVAYFRKQWRVALFTYCPVHKVELYDACPSCKKPVMYYRGDFGRDIKGALPIAMCYACGYDFRGAEIKPICFPSADLSEIYTNMLNSLIYPCSTDKIFDFGFFSVMHQLCKVMGTRQNHGALLAYLSDRISLPILAMPNGWVTIEERRRYERFIWLNCLLWLMDDLEKRLIEAWKAKAIRYNLMRRDFKDAPQWYCNISNKCENWRNA
ncbi:MAG: TniQ family protein [Candidatus Thiodiazotropha sp.]